MLSDCELGCCCCKCHRFTNAALKQASVNKNRRDCINNVFSSNVIWNIIGLNSKLLLLISKIISVISFFMIVLILIEPCGATHLKHRGSTESPRASLVNEAGVFTLRDKQNGGQRSKRTSTTSTSSLRSSTSSTASTNYVSSNSNDDDEEEDVVVEPIALFARKDMAWKTESSNTSSSSSSSSSTGGDIISLSLQTIEPPIELIVKPLSKVVLPCELEGNYTRLLMPAVRSYRIRPASWLHGGTLVDMITIDTRTEMSGTGHRYIGDSSTAALHIDSVKLEDDGTWTCQLEDDRGKLLIGRLVKLVVLEEPKGMYLLIDGRRLDPGNQFVPVKEGSELSLECIVEGGNPAPILAWSMTLSQATLDGPEPLPDNLTIVASISPVRSKAHLKVLRGHHNATIICVVRHITLEMPMSSSILLDVQYTPSFAITRLPGFGIPIIEGMSVSLKCEVDSNPSSAPIWQRDNGPPPVEQSNDGWLNFTQISRAESGWYKCYTRHMLGIFTSIGYFLNVRYDPEIETEAEALSGESRDSRKIEVQIGGAVTLECDGGCWGHGSDMNPVGGPGSLILNRVVYQDAGEYRCVAPDRKMQDTWRAQLPYHVKVKGPPMVYPSNQTMMTNEGDSLDVVVEFCAEPIYTKVLWISEENIYVPGGELRNGVRALPIQDSSTSACYRSILRFEEIQREHAGEWLLLIRSTEGLTNAMVSLNVTHAAGYSHAHMCSPSLMRIIVCLLLLLLCSRHRP